MIPNLTCRSLIHFEFVFLYSVAKCSNLMPLLVAVQFFQHRLMKRLFFPLYILASFAID